MRTTFSRGPQRSRLFDLIINSDILALKKSHISEYYRFSLELSSTANLFCAAKASTPGIPSAEWTIGVKFCLRFSQASLSQLYTDSDVSLTLRQLPSLTVSKSSSAGRAED